MSNRFFVLAFVLVSFGTIVASANEADEAQFFDERGRQAYEAGDYQKALEAFLLVHEIAPSHRSLYNIAVCADLAGKNDMAFAGYRDYLAGTDPDTERRREAERRAALLESKLAVVEVTSDPPGAEIYIDRKELGLYGTAPQTIVVGSGERQILLELAGHGGAVVPVVTRIGVRSRVSVTLQPLFGHVTVDVVPASSRLAFLRDEKPVAAVMEGGNYRLPVGPYTVVASAPGHVTATARVVVGEHDPSHLALGLAPLPQPSGRLLVSTGKLAADVYVDGRRMAVTPATLPALSAGQHVVEVRSGARASSRRVTIQAGHATYVELALGAAR